MAKCCSCEGALTIEIDGADDDDSDSESMIATTQSVPDDVRLACGDHFHWRCLMDSSYELSKCPSCNRDISFPPDPLDSSGSDSNPRILVNINNEGGLQENIDLFPILREESYLKAYPEERRCRAFLELCREGDYHAVVGLLTSNEEQNQHDEDENDGANPGQDDPQQAAAHRSPNEDAVLRYQDPLAGEQSGLHAAAANGHREIAWLLLLLASSYPELEFPAIVFQEAAALGIMRSDQAGKPDIRELRDANGRTAEDVARETNDVVWNGWIGSGRLALP